jgi:hypothetical protein
MRTDSKGIGVGTRNWIDSARDSDYWEAIVNTAVNFRILCAMELVSSSKIRSFLVQVPFT